MKEGYWNIVNKVVGAADVVVEVLDARFPALTRIARLEALVKKNPGKRLILAINKADLVSKDALERLGSIYSKQNCVILSAKNSIGINELVVMIRESSGKSRKKVAIVGYPNTGKSILINRLSKRARVGTSSESGFTKGMQHISGKQGFMLIDTPGIVPFEDRDELRLGIVSGISPSKLSDPELVAFELLDIFRKNNPKALLDAYGIDADNDEFLTELARKRNMLLKGNIPDERRAAIEFLNDWHKGKVRV